MGIAPLIAPIIFSIAMTAWSHAIAHMRQCSLISACIMHSAEQARHITTVVCIIDIVTCMSMPFMRSSMRIIVSQTSAQFEHMAAQRPMPSPASASAHMMHACTHAERASIHSCIIAGSMPFMGISDDDMAPFIMSIVMFIWLAVPGRPSADDAGGGVSAALFGAMLRRAPSAEKGLGEAFTSAKQGRMPTTGGRGIRPWDAVHYRAAASASPSASRFSAVRPAAS